MCNRSVYRTQKRSGYTRLKILAYFSVCILTLGVFTEHKTGWKCIFENIVFNMRFQPLGVFEEL
ncbi:hypothetical protein SAMN05720489_2178 [Fibrobacter sp. UWB13]|nr:hypothetical protein SAMN05720489_2178 [Fibrobacter sp. UWB13]